MLFLAGVDEVGRGPLAGPVTACCLVLNPNYLGKRLNDSKELSAAEREELCEEIRDSSLALSVVSVGPRRIEQINIRRASMLAMRHAIERVGEQLQQRCGRDCVSLFVLSDGDMRLDTKYRNEPIVKGDKRIKVISAASIVAKVARDELAVSFERFYPGYGFSSHKGYPTPAHKQAVSQLGPSRIHRRTFAGVREFISITP